MLVLSVLLHLVFFVSAASIPFVPGRGIYDAPLTVILNITAGTCVKYTVGTDANPLQAGALNYVIGTKITITKSTWIQAILCGETATSKIATHSYFIRTIAQLKLQTANPAGYPSTWVDNQNGCSRASDYAMSASILDNATNQASILLGLRDIPTVSLVTPIAYLYDRATGIFTNADAVNNTPFEHETSLEFLDFRDPSDPVTWGTRAGVRPVGGSSTQCFKSPRASLNIYWRSEYGDSKLKEDVYGGGVQVFDSLRLQAGLNNLWTYDGDTEPDQQRNRSFGVVRDKFTADIIRNLGPSQPRGLNVNLYINSMYWGIYNLKEIPNQDYVSRIFGGAKESYNCIKHNNVVVGSSSLVSYQNLFSVVNGAGTADQLYAKLDALIEFDDFIDYWLANILVGNTDWDSHNLYACASNDTRVLKWTWFSWDAEHILENMEDQTGLNNDDAPSRIITRLQTSNEFRIRIQNRVWKHFVSPTGYLYIDNANKSCLTGNNQPCKQFLSRVDKLSNAIFLESARWGDCCRHPYRLTKDDWLRERKRCMGLFETPIPILTWMKNMGFYPTLPAPTISYTVSNKVYTITISAGPSNTAIYYTIVHDTDPRGVGGVINGTQYTKAFTSSNYYSPTYVIARYRQNATVWSPIGKLVLPADLSSLKLTEIMHSANGGSDYEFLEFKNVATANNLDLSGIEFSDGIEFKFPFGTTVAPGAFVIVASNVSAFASQYGKSIVPVGAWKDGYGGLGKHIALKYQTDVNFIDLKFNNDSTWPNGGDKSGTKGHSLVPKLQNASANPNLGSTWRLSTLNNGSPGKDDPEPSNAPTRSPSANPTRAPSQPTLNPTSLAPSKSPVVAPVGTVTKAPTRNPTPGPTNLPTATSLPTSFPTANPTQAPTLPTLQPTPVPLGTPTLEPTAEPSSAPTVRTEAPTEFPTRDSTEAGPNAPVESVPVAPTGSNQPSAMSLSDTSQSLSLSDCLSFSDICAQFNANRIAMMRNWSSMLFLTTGFSLTNITDCEFDDNGLSFRINIASPSPNETAVCESVQDFVDRDFNKPSLCYQFACQSSKKRDGDSTDFAISLTAPSDSETPFWVYLIAVIVAVFLVAVLIVLMLTIGVMRKKSERDRLELEMTGDRYHNL